MDFLPRPSHKTPPIQIPFIAEYAYDGGDFLSFPTRCGFDIEKLGDEPAQSLASIAQSWLYFGAIGMFFQTFGRTSRTMDIGSYKTRCSVDETGRPLVSPEALSMQLDTWFKVIVDPLYGKTVVTSPEEHRFDMRIGDMEELVGRKATCLERLEAALFQANKLESLPQSTTDPLPVILLSIKTLLISLTSFLKTATPDESDMSSFERNIQLTEVYELDSVERCSPLSDIWQQPSPSAKFLLSRFQDRGWCIFRARQICSRYSYPVAYYLSQLPIQSSHISHEDCSTNGCIANNVDMSNYMTRHVSNGCSCEMVEVPQKKLREIVGSGGIPLISVQEDDYGRVRLDVQPSGHATNFIAYSHVWSDGLGNPRANALPQCQLRRLANCTRNATTPTSQLSGKFATIGSLKWDVARLSSDLKTEWFWLDTLCIPVGKGPDVFALKMQAINQMAAIYASAMQVLVLDSSLEAVFPSKLAPCQLFAHINIMAWMTRCWTFQEAALAGDCQLQTAEKSLDPLRVPLESKPMMIQGLLQSRNRRQLIRRSISCWYTVYLIVRNRRQPTSPELRGRLITRPTSAEEAMQIILARPLKIALHNDFQLRRKSIFDKENVNLGSYFDFIRCWNVLGQRTTTMLDDIHIIIANLLDFNAFTILNIKEPERRMAILLWSLPAIPIGMFFDRASQRYNPNQYHENRWLPLYPSKHGFNSTVGLVPRGDKLILDSKHAVRRKGDELPSVLSLTFIPRVSALQLWDEATSSIYKVKFYRSPDDQFLASTQDFLQTILVVGNFRETFPDGPKIQARSAVSGACFHVYGPDIKETPTATQKPSKASADEVRHGGKRRIQVIYDCPITLEIERGSDSEKSSPPVQGFTKFEPISPPFCLEVKVDPPQIEKPLSQRPQQPRLGMVLGLTLIPFLILSLWLDLVAAILLIVSCHRDFGHFPIPSRLAAVLIFVFDAMSLFIRFVPFRAPTYKSTMLFIALRMGVGITYLAPMYTMGHYDRDRGLAVAITALTLVSVVLHTSAWTSWKFILAPRVFNAWRETFHPDWPLEKATGFFAWLGHIDRHVFTT